MIQSLQFPNMFYKGQTKVVKDHEATASNLKLLLLSDKTALFGDPYFGTNIRRYMFDQNNALLRDIIIDSLYTAITQFMPQILVQRSDITITSDKTKVFINIKAKNLIDYQTDLYNITLTGSEIS